MAASKVMEQFDSQQFKGFNNQLPKKIPPITEVVTRKPKKIEMSQSLVAPVEKYDVPNHLLNTSKIYILLIVKFLKRNY